jgi:hypothetical protein
MPSTDELQSSLATAFPQRRVVVEEGAGAGVSIIFDGDSRAGRPRDGDVRDPAGS